MKATAAQRATRIALGILAVLVVAWMVLPTLIVIPISFTTRRVMVFPPDGFTLQWYERFFTDPKWYEAALTTLQVSLLSAILATILGTAASLGLMRVRPSWRIGLAGFYLTPMIFPIIVIAIGFYAVALQLGLIGTIAGFVAAHTVIAFPFVVTSVFAGLQGFDTRLELAARSLGANYFVTFFRVTMPMIMPSVMAGFIFAFVVSLDEVVLSLFLKDPYISLLSIQMYSSMVDAVDPTVAATASMVLVTTTVIIGIGLFVATRGLRRRTR